MTFYGMRMLFFAGMVAGIVFYVPARAADPALDYFLIKFDIPEQGWFESDGRFQKRLSDFISKRQKNWALWNDALKKMANH